MTEQPKQESSGKGALPECFVLAGLVLLGVGISFEYSWSMAAIVIGAILFVLGFWSALR